MPGGSQLLPTEPPIVSRMLVADVFDVRTFWFRRDIDPLKEFAETSATFYPAGVQNRSVHGRPQASWLNAKGYLE
jgi:hypothetical protein